MCCSASQLICSRSSAGVMSGIVIFLMITLCPLTRMRDVAVLLLVEELVQPFHDQRRC
jgi:hypothetical protein